MARHRVVNARVAALVSTLLLCGTAAPAQPTRPPVGRPVADDFRRLRVAPPVTKQQKLAREVWRKGLVAARPAAHSGCYTAVYPSRLWREIPCSPPPLRPYPPATGVRPETIGNQNDFSAVVGGSLTSAEGTFDSITGLTSESNIDTSGNSTGSNSYTLQVNANTFSSPQCVHADVPANCIAWQQWVYSNTFGMVIQYWLIRFSAHCPSGFQAFTNTNGDLDCFRNGDHGISIGGGSGQIPQQPLSNLKNLTLTATAGQGSAKDTFVFSDGSQAWTDSEDNTILGGLNAGWNTAEFNVFGDCCDAQAQFNNGTIMVVRTIVHNGTTNAPTCLNEGFTGETNNLNLVNNPSVPVAPSPAIVFTQSTSTGTAACATASSTGDTHLATFDNVFYDFQAFGDFVLVDSGDFVVQTRQQEAPSNYPGTAVNKAVAVKMGPSRVVLTLGAPSPLAVNGVNRTLDDRHTLTLPGEVYITHQGATWFIRDRIGDAVRAEFTANWINVFVGLSRAPHPSTRGLLGNPVGAADTIVARDGVALHAPFAFADLYHHYADSWRVTSQDSLFVNRPAVIGIPAKALYAADLAPADRARARTACLARGVTNATLLDACTLDTAVLKDPAATRVFTRLRAPIRELRVKRIAVRPVVR